MSDDRPLSVELTYLVQVLGNMPIVHGDGVPAKHVREIIPVADVLRTRAAALEAEVAELREALRRIKANAVPFNIDREKHIVTLGEKGEWA